MGSGPNAGRHNVERLAGALRTGTNDIVSNCVGSGSVGALLLNADQTTGEGELVLAKQEVVLEISGRAVAKLRASSKADKLRACLSAGFAYAGKLEVKGASVRVQYKSL